MSIDSKKSERERDIIKKIDDEIAEIRKKTHQFRDENPLTRFDAEVVDLSDKIHSGVLPNMKKPTIH
ncbi:MAG: hypothetical protein HQL70_10940 [Magnetococcales bacterium]|nr:hypothetical protein [Magnetococcales bacterium]